MVTSFTRAEIRERMLKAKKRRRTTMRTRGRSLSPGLQKGKCQRLKEGSVEEDIASKNLAAGKMK
jgi:hypothetical protein